MELLVGGWNRFKSDEGWVGSIEREVVLASWGYLGPHQRNGLRPGSNGSEDAGKKTRPQEMLYCHSLGTVSRCPGVTACR